MHEAVEMVARQPELGVDGHAGERPPPLIVRHPSVGPVRAGLVQAIEQKINE